MESGLELDNLSGESNYNDWRMYGRSKLANILFAKALQKRFEGSNRTANSVHPGVIRTNLARHVENVEAMFESLKDRVTLKSVEQGAATQCLVATRPELAGVGGKYFKELGYSQDKVKRFLYRKLKAGDWYINASDTVLYGFADKVLTSWQKLN